MVTLKSPGKESGFRPNLKRPRVDAVRDFPEGCGRAAPRVKLSECGNRRGDVKTLPRETRPLPPRVDAVRDFPEGCGRAAPRVKLSECGNRRGDVKTLPRETRPLPPRVDAVRDFPKGRGTVAVSFFKDAGEKSLIPFVKDKGSEQRCVDHKLSVASVVGDRARNKVKKALAAYQEALTEMGEECDANGDKLRGWKLYSEAAMFLKKKWVNTQKRIGHIPGVQVGDKFRYRPELTIVGLHGHFQCGIDFMTKNGIKIATSIVDSGRYANKQESPDVLIYTGQGGNPTVTKGKPRDQTPTRGNLALMNSKEAGTPVRVIRSFKFREDSGYIYAGLYTVDGYCQKRGDFGKLVFKFLLRRIPDQPKLALCKS